MKSKLHFIDVGSGTTSQLKMREKSGKKRIKLINGAGFTRPGKIRMTLTKHCALGDEDAVVIENDDYVIEIDFLTLCDLKDILTHADALGNNWFGKTKVLK